MSASFPLCRQGELEFVISTNEELQEESRFLSQDFPIALYTQHFNHAASDSVPFHWHEELQATWVWEGELECSIHGKQLILGNDKLLLVKQHQLHSSRTTTGDANTLCINFTPEIFHPLILEKYISPLLDSQSFTYALVHLQPFELSMLKNLLDQSQQPLEYFSVMNFLSLIFEHIVKDQQENQEIPNPEEMKIFQELLHFVHTNYAEPLTVKDISAAGIINKNRCTALFQKYTGLSPIKYLNEYRLYTAKNLILHTDRSISDISGDVGYNQISYFIQQFSASYGMPPLKYRNQFRKKV